MNPIEAVPEAFATTGRGVSATVDALGKVFSASGIERYGKTVTNSKGGFNDQERPRSVVGIVASGEDITGGNWWVLLGLLASINVFVALFNLLPLPPLDGGHAAVAIYEGIASRLRGHRVRVDYQKLMPVAAAVVVVILMFGLSTHLPRPPQPVALLGVVNPSSTRPGGVTRRRGGRGSSRRSRRGSRRATAGRC